MLLVHLFSQAGGIMQETELLESLWHAICICLTARFVCINEATVITVT